MWIEEKFTSTKNLTTEDASYELSNETESAVNNESVQGDFMRFNKILRLC
jgi:hypothetical protein